LADKKIFLATTAIEEFWDTSGTLLVLGEWCRRYSRKDYLESLDTIALDPPYSDADVPAIFTYLDEVYERALPLLAGKLNVIHGVCHSERYWRILVGTWLLHLIHAVYDRYAHIAAALAIYPELTTLCLDEESFQTPGETIEFMELLKSDLYNLQIFSRLLGRLKGAFPKKKVDRSEYSQASVHKVMPNRAVSLTKRFVARSLSAPGGRSGKIFYHNAYFPRSTETKLMMMTGFAMARFYYPPIDFGGMAPDAPKRMELGNEVFGDNEFERLLFGFIGDEIPIVFLERYAETDAAVHEVYREEPVALMSATSWHYNDVFKIWAGSRAENGAVLVGLQHGGNYGIIRYFLQEKQELSVVDRFYSWGWTRNSAGAEIRPLSSTKLLGRERDKGRRKRGHVLYDLAVWMRCLVQFPLTTEYWRRYFEDIRVFAGSLSGEVMADLRVRPHREDMGWEVRERLKDIFPATVPVETWDVPFEKSLRECRLFLCGHPMYSTTFIEALHINKPTVLFYDPSFAANTLHPDAVDYFEDLRSAGILFESPTEAARQVNEVHGHADEWWNEGARQRTVMRFRTRFGRVSENAMDEWARELKGILSSGRRRA
jgi:putative transferase (TIGR04331 family)